MCIDMDICLCMDICMDMNDMRCTNRWAQTSEQRRRQRRAAATLARRCRRHHTHDLIRQGPAPLAIPCLHLLSKRASTLACIHQRTRLGDSCSPRSALQTSVRDTYITQVLACNHQRQRVPSPRHRCPPCARACCPPLAVASGVGRGGGGQAAAAARVGACERAAAAAGCWGLLRVVLRNAGRAESEGGGGRAAGQSAACAAAAGRGGPQIPLVCVSRSETPLSLCLECVVAAPQPACLRPVAARSGIRSWWRSHAAAVW